MNYARIQDGLVAEIIAPFYNDDGALVAIEDRFAPDLVATLVQAPANVTQGYTYADGKFTAPVPYEDASTVPPEVTMRQFRLALVGAGKYAAAQAAVAVGGDAVMIEWEFAATVPRSGALVAFLADALALDGDALDTLFTAAAGL